MGPNGQVHSHDAWALAPLPVQNSLGCSASPWDPSHAGPAPATSNCLCLLHQGDKGAIGMPGRVVSWHIFPCFGGHCLLLHASLSSKPCQGVVYPRQGKRENGGFGPPSSLTEVSFREAQARRREDVLFQPFRSCHMALPSRELPWQRKNPRKSMNKALCQSPTGRAG